MSKKFLKREDLAGKEVIDLDATRIGVVKDVGFDPESKKLVIIVAKKVESGVEEESYVLGESVEKIKDVMLVKPGAP